jgi:hypothetical protein
MFQQYVGSGADLFILIVSVIIGFATALAYLDYRKTKKEQEEPEA